MTAPGTAARWTLAHCPVTVGEYRLFVESTNRDWPGVSDGWPDEWPAVNVSWDDATAYCEWRTAQGHPCRLPTDAEWLAGLPDPDWTIGQECDRNGRAVWEWSADPWDSSDPAGPRVLRGGSWINLQINARAAVRFLNPPLERNWDVGFRVVVAPAVPVPPASGDSGSGSGARDVPLEVLALVNKLHAEIMNLPHRHGFGVEYAAGHRDARHAAAEALARSDAALALATLAAAGLALREAVAELAESDPEVDPCHCPVPPGECDWCDSVRAYDAALAAALRGGGA